MQLLYEKYKLRSNEIQYEGLISEAGNFVFLHYDHHYYENIGQIYIFIAT